MSIDKCNSHTHQGNFSLQQETITVNHNQTKFRVRELNPNITSTKYTHAQGSENAAEVRVKG